MKFKIKFINYNYDTDFSECSIYLSKSNLELLKLEQGIFVDLNLFKFINNQTKLIKKRNVKLLVLENVKDDFIYLTSILWFNLINNQQIEFDYSIDQFYIEIKSSSLLFPKIINESHFALVKCPDYNGSVNYDNLFKSYFQNKRFIQLNDVIAIKTITYPQIYNEFNFQSSIKQTYIFFKCTNLDKFTEGILDQNETRMYLIGNQNNFIPRDLYYLDFNSFNFFIKYNKLNSTINNKMLNNYYNKLKEFTFPSIKEYSLANFILLTGDLGSGKEYLINQLACEFRMNLIEFDADDFLNDTLTINETKIKTNFQLITIYSPCIFVFKNIDILIKSIEGNELRFIELIKLNLDLERKNLEYPILLIATSSTMNCDQILENTEFSKLFKQQLHIDNLRFDERYEILNFIITKLSNNDQLNNQLNELIDIEFLAKETAGLNLTNLINLFKKVLLSKEDRILNNDNLINILKQYKKNLKIKNNLPDIPNVSWSDVGGLEDAKKEIFFTIQLTLKYGKLLNSKLKRSGLLFYGPPGTGKTLLAKAIATVFKLNFLSVKGPEIMNMFIGQSEENIRNIFKKAKSIAPSIIFFDELDSIARKRGKNNSSSGVMDRLVSTLLTELDNLDSMESNETEFKPVFVIGATNRPDLLDSALLRYGRFDKLVYIGLDNSKKQRLSILKAITNKFEFDSDCNLEDIESICPSNLTGADFYGLCSNAHLNALKRKINYLEKCENKIIDDDDKVKVNLEDFKESIRNLRLSINEDELNKYEQLNKKFSSK